MTEKINGNTKEELIMKFLDIIENFVDTIKEEDNNNNKIEKIEEYNMMSINELVDWCEKEGFKMSYNTINNFIKEGELPFLKVGNKRLIKLSNFKELLNGKTYIEEEETYDKSLDKYRLSS